MEERTRSSSSCSALPVDCELAPPAFEEVEEFDPDAPPPVSRHTLPFVVTHPSCHTQNLFVPRVQSYYECVGVPSVMDDCSVEVGSVQPLDEAGDASQSGVHRLQHSQSNFSLNSPRLRNLRNGSSEACLNGRPYSMFPLPSDKQRKSKRLSSKFRNANQPRQRASSTSAANRSLAEMSERNDMQSLLTDASRARSGQVAVSAHAERLRAAEDRRLSRQNSAR